MRPKTILSANFDFSRNAKKIPTIAIIKEIVFSEIAPTNAADELSDVPRIHRVTTFKTSGIVPRLLTKFDDIF
jgi:hypothetical protein